MAHLQSCLSIIQGHFCQITYTDGCEFKSLLNKSAIRVFQQNEEEKVSVRENQVTKALTSKLLKIIGIDVESLKDFSSKMVLFIRCLSLTEFIRSSKGNDILLGIESIFSDLKKI